MEGSEFSLFLVGKNLIDRSNSIFERIMGWSDTDLFRRPMSFLVPADAHDRVGKLLEHEEELLTSVIFPRVPLRVRSGGYINFDMKIERLDDERRRLDFFKPGRLSNGESTPGAVTDMDTFFSFVDMLIHSPYVGDLDLTLVSVEALYPGSVVGLSDEQRAEAKKQIEASLSRAAVGGQVVKLDDASYALLSDCDAAESALHEELAAVAERFNIDPGLLQARTERISIDGRDIESEKLRQALNHSRGVFLGEIDVYGNFKTLSQVFDGIEHNRQVVQSALAEDRFLLAHRVVFDLRKARAVGQLQQGKVVVDRRIRQTDEIVVLSDHPDIALQHDLLMVERLVKARAKHGKFDRGSADFFNLNPSTIGQDDFTTGVAEIMGQYDVDARHIGFRIKDLPPVRAGGARWTALKSLAARGHPLWMDRFGDIVLEPETLACMKGGFVELSPALMKKLDAHPDGKDLMLKLIKTWQDMDVRVVSADLPNDKMKELAQKLGIGFGLEDPAEDRPQSSAAQ